MKPLRPLKTFETLLLGASIATVVAMLVIGYSYMVNPNSFALAGPMGLLFPAMLAINIGFLLLFLVLRKYRLMLAPFAGMLLCYSPIRLYCPLNLPHEAPSDCIRFMSYNVLGFHGLDSEYICDGQNPLFHYLVDQDQDIVCVQEDSYFLYDSAVALLQPVYPNIQHVNLNAQSSTMGIYTKYPILQTDTIDFGSKGNLAVGFILQTPKGRLLVVNCHLETNGLSVEDKQNFSSMMKGRMARDSISDESFGLFAKLAGASKIRSRQMETIMDYVSSHGGMKTILCGDFNENPLSYPHYLANRKFTDCFTYSGFGLGWSYCHNAMRVRIDNIFCSQDITPYECHVDNTVPYSDHYPIMAKLKFD